MKLVFLYGPPAVGKLTIARSLSERTGYKIFHNHLTLDLVGSVFDWGTQIFWNFVDRYRLELIEAAAREHIPGLIFTFVYARPHDDTFVRKVVKRVERHGGRVCFVQLVCDRQELFRRLKHPTRKAFRKMKKVSNLKELLERFDLFSSVPHPNGLRIDNTKLSAKRVAQMIERYYHFL